MSYASPTDTLINRRLTRVFLSFFFLCPNKSGVSINIEFFRSRKNCTKPATGTNNFTEVELDISSPFFSLLQRYIYRNFTLFSFILMETIEAKEKLYFKIGDKIFFFLSSSTIIEYRVVITKRGGLSLNKTGQGFT